MAQADYFLKLDGVDGESMDAQYKDHIEVESFSWGATQTGTTAFGGGAGTGKVQFQDFHFVSGLSKASPKLMLACATGQHIKKAQLFCRKAGGDVNRAGFAFMKVVLEDVLISSYQDGAGGGNLPTDQFSLNFAKIEFSYTPQKADGSADAAVTAGWDLKANKKI